MNTKERIKEEQETTTKKKNVKDKDNDKGG